MGNGRRLRRAAGNRRVIHEWHGPECPHCGAGFDQGFELMDTQAEFRAAAAAHSVDVAVPVLGPDAVMAWWFCHRCGEGGGLLRSM